MEVDLAGDDEPQPLVIRYEGGDAARHELELNQLGESLQGFAKVFSVVSNYAATGTLAQHYDALQVRVYARPVGEHKCYEVWAIAKAIASTKEFWAGTAVVVIGPIIAYVFSKRGKDEMKHLSEALTLSMKGNQDVTDRLLLTVEKLAMAVTPSVRKALAPIERSCEEISLYSGTTLVQTMDAEIKHAFAVGASRIADHSKQFMGLISEFDMLTGTCKVKLEDEEERVLARVVDPVYAEPNNPYVEAMAAKVPLRFLAKYEVDDQGRLAKLHIFDTVEG